MKDGKNVVSYINILEEIFSLVFADGCGICVELDEKTKDLFDKDVKKVVIFNEDGKMKFQAANNTKFKHGNRVLLD